jgi:hypothetical protein
MERGKNEDKWNVLREKGIGVEAEGEEIKQVSGEKKQQKICDVLTVIALGAELL